MLDEKWVLVGAALNVFGGLNYLVGTLKGRVKPNRVTWLFWALAPLIAFIAELDKGVGLQSLMTFMVGFNPLLIFLASFVNKQAYWQLHRLDYVYGGLALLGMILWQLTGEGNVAILLAILADALAGVPTVVKACREPETENEWIFFFGGISAVITLLTVKVWSFAYWGFPVYILGICAVLFGLIKFKLGRKVGMYARPG